MNKKILTILTLAVLTESVITYFKEFFAAGCFSFSMFLSILVGVAVAFAYDLDIPKCFEINSSVPFFGNILTGILISRGSNYIHDVISAISDLK